MDISARVLNASLCPCTILPIGLAGAGFCSAKIKSCVEGIVESVEEICGMLNCFGKNSTVSDIFSALVLGMYALCYI